MQLKIHLYKHKTLHVFFPPWILKDQVIFSMYDFAFLYIYRMVFHLFPQFL